LFAVHLNSDDLSRILYAHAVLLMYKGVLTMSDVKQLL